MLIEVEETVQRERTRLEEERRDKERMLCGGLNVLGEGGGRPEERVKA
jgi:hypothetical protein